MAYREVVDSGSGFPMNNGEAGTPRVSPARALYEDKPTARKAFDIEDNTMQRKRENNGGQEIPGAIMNKISRMGLPSPKTVPGYLAVGGPAFPRTSSANVENNDEVKRNPLLELILGREYRTSKTTSGRQHTSKTAPIDIWGASEIYDRLPMKSDREEHIGMYMTSLSWLSPASDVAAAANVRQVATGAAQSALGAEAPQWEMPETHGGVSVEEFTKYLISSIKLHELSESQGDNFGVQHADDRDDGVRKTWGSCCQNDMYRRVPLAESRGDNFGVQQNDRDEGVRKTWGFCCQNDMYRRVPSRPQPIEPRGAWRDAGGAALFDPWGSLIQDAMFKSLPHPETPPQAPTVYSTPRDPVDHPSDLWAPLNLDIEYVSVVPGTDGAQRGAVGDRPLATDAREARSVVPETVPDQVAPKKPLILLTPEDFLTLSNTDISSMLGGGTSTKTDTASVQSDDGSDETEGEPAADSEQGSVTESGGKDEKSEDGSEKSGDESDEDGEYIHPMQVISDSIDKVDSWLQKHSDVLAAGVAAAARVAEEAPLFEMPPDDEVVESCRDIKRREFESTLDLARRKLRANCIKFERVAARFEKLYNEHLLEKSWLAELEAMKGKMSIESPKLSKLNKTKRNEAPAPADVNAPGPSGLARK